jgi:hypothetical protein
MHAQEQRHPTVGEVAMDPRDPLPALGADVNVVAFGSHPESSNGA